MRIALCKSYFSGPQSGADEVLVSYATLLHKTGHEVEVILSYKPSDNDQYYKRLQAAGVTVPYIIRRPLIYRCLRVLRKFLAGLFFFLFLVPPLVVKLREIWQGILERLTSRNYGQCREHLARRAPDLLHTSSRQTPGRH